MTCFLTSSPMLPDRVELNPANGFIDTLRQAFPMNGSGLFVCSDPDVPELTDHFADDVRVSFEKAGFVFGSYTVLDGRNAGDTEALVRGADMIVLAGGHVPTQNRFFRRIRLKEALRGFGGVVMGISAGSMNSAKVVYAQPERPGEAANPYFQKFLVGLGLTKTMLLPHYQMVKDDVLDGLRLFEDITYEDSRGRCFCAIEDGTYLYIHDGTEEIRGRAYLIRDGQITVKE